jgi:signal transduction histidine kinase
MMAGKGRARAAGASQKRRRAARKSPRRAKNAGRPGQAAGEGGTRSAETAALLVASRAILQQHTFVDAARAIFDACKGLIGATAGYIALLSEDGSENEVVFLDAGGLSCTVDPSLPMPIRGLRAEAYRSGETVFNNDFHRSPHQKFMPPGHARLDNVMFAPLRIGGKTVGLMGLANKPGGFTAHDGRMATAFGELAAVALSNSRAEEEVRKARDALEVRVRQRTGELEQANIALQDEVAERERAQRRAAAEHERLFSVLGMIPGFAMLVRPDGSIAFANGRFLEAFGDPGGRRCFEVLRGRDRPCDVCHTKEVLRTGVPGQWEWTGPTGRAYRVWGYPFEDADGSRLALELGIDITDHKELEREILEISDEEQQRIGRDLHDMLGQNLTGIAFLSKVLARRLAERAAAEAEQADQIAQLVSTALSQARTISHGLCPVELTAEGLMIAMRQLADGVERLFGIPCSFDCPSPVLISDAAAAKNLYHIAQEAVSNATKHAQPRQLRIALLEDGGRMSLSVSDDGVGLPERLPQDKGMGLRIMNYRANLIGATLQVGRGPAGGTRVVCSLPSVPGKGG